MSSTESTERLIASGTLGGLLTGIGVGAVAAALAALFIYGAVGAFGDDDPVKGAFVLAFGLIMVAASVNCVYSGVAAWRARRAGRPLRRKDGMAGEYRVFAAVERGELWAAGVTSGYGLVFATAGIAGLATAEEVTLSHVFTAVVMGGFGGAFIWYAIHKRRHPGKEED